MTERYSLAKERISEAVDEIKGLSMYGPFFESVFKYTLELLDIYEDIKENGPIKGKTLEELRKRNDVLFSDIYPDNYSNSFANPDYAVNTLGKCGIYFCVLYAEIRGLIPFIFENKLERIVIRLELLLEVYGSVKQALEDNEDVKEDNLKDILYYYVFDYTEEESFDRCNAQLNPEGDYAVNIISNYDLTDVRTLYAFGEYVGVCEEETFKILAELDEEKINLMCDTYCQGFKRGFEVAGKDMSKKNTVNIRYRLGFERVVGKAIKEYEKMGLKSIIYRAGYDIFSRSGIDKPGYYGGFANPQFDEDHKEDMALILDGQLVTRRLEGIKAAYEEYKDFAAKWAGPACMEVFGDVPFVPQECENALRFKGDKAPVIQEFRRKASEITNEYIKREERSFTIIAWPTVMITWNEENPYIDLEKYIDILDEIITVNTLPVDTYCKIQEVLIGTLDESEYAHIKGMNGNHTDLKVSLYELKDKEKETKFENCLSDVNIPLGEVFTSPVLKGTEGVLHVKEVFLNDLCFKDLSLTIKDGKIVDYSLGNYSDEAKNKAFVEENLLFHHPSLPMGEFAIGTNTYAYALAKRLNMFNKLPILIAEKMGPHFAFGDTCYSNEENVRVFNPNGKEMMAKRNGEPYTYCHTDITIPYDELGLLEAVNEKGESVSIIENGRFVLNGCEELNKALDD